MARQTTPTFIVELPLAVSARDEGEMLIRLEIGRQLYNACLGEALRRLSRMRDSLAWQRASALRGPAHKKARIAAFQLARAAYGFTSASLSAFGTQCKNAAGWNAGRKHTDPRLGAHETQRIAERAFDTVEQYCFGTRGKPRFKGKNRPLHALSGKSDGSSIRWNTTAGCLQWGSLSLFASLPPVGKDAWLEQALYSGAHRTKYARIVWRNIKGVRRWFVQLAQEGLPPLKYATRAGAVVGTDVGPSTIAVYAEKGAALVPLAPEVEQPWRQVKTLQRAMDRSRRATNPHCFNADGTWKPGQKVTVRSNHYFTLQDKLAEIERVLQKTRDRSHGRLANQIVALGNIHQSETLLHRAWQKNFGRSTKVRAAGSLMQKIRRKVERTGGEYRELNTWSLKLSQYDHTTNTCTKKPLSQRWHVLGDGTGVVQRDMYSAFLAFAVNCAGKNGVDKDRQKNQQALHPSQAASAWSVAQSLLGCSGWLRNQPANVASVLATVSGASLLPAAERVEQQRVSVQGDAWDDVAAKREPVRTLEYGLRTHCL